MNDLDSLFLKYGSDKSSNGHCYSKLIYEPLFESMRNDSFTLLEIGTQFGFSLKAWSDFFPNAKIIGVDVIDNGVDFSGYPRIEFIQGSQSDPAVLELLRSKGPFRFICEDGSHESNDILASFGILFHALEPDGVYCIEDTHWKGAEEAVCWFHNLADRISEGEPPQCGDSRNTKTTVQSVTFHRSMITVRRKP